MDDELEQIAKIPGSVIFLNFFLFFYTSLYLIYRRRKHPKDYIGNSKGMKVCGWILILFAIVLAILIIPDANIENYRALLFVGLAGCYTIFRANRMRKNGDRYMSQFNQPVTRQIDYDYTVDIHEHNCNPTYDSTVKPKMAPQFKVVICPNCGAKMKAEAGSVVRCEYCDTPLGA